jgi:hypothetical protein
MEHASRIPRALLFSLALIVAFLAGFLCSRATTSPFTRLQTLSSHDRAHQAQLWRLDHVDRNYSVYLDGRKIFGSEDFARNSSLPFRETLFWDRTDRFVILEVAGHRIFGYDAAAGRRLTDSELLAAKPPPEPSLWEYSSETEWPGIGRTTVPVDGR